jgi:hypothetical protein
MFPYGGVVKMIISHVRISSILIIAGIFLFGCGGGGDDGGGGGGGSTPSNVFESAYKILNTFVVPTETHSTSIYSSASGHGSGCSSGGGISRDELTAFVKSQTPYSLCGTQNNEFENPLCIYPGQNAYRTLEVSAHPEYPDAEQEMIFIKLNEGQVRFTHTYESSRYEFEYKAYNANNACNVENIFNFEGADIEGSYSSLVVSLDQNGVPITRLAGSLSCDSRECSGTIGINDLSYDSQNESWLGQMEFEGVQYDMIATLSPNKKIAVFVGCLDPPESQDIPSSCVFVGASK